MDDNKDSNVNPSATPENTPTPEAPEGVPTPEAPVANTAESTGVGIEPDQTSESTPPVSPTPTSNPNPFSTFAPDPKTDGDEPTDLNEALQDANATGKSEDSAKNSSSPDVFAKPPKKKGLLVILVIVLVLLLAGAAAAYFLYFQPKTDTADTKKTDTTNTDNSQTTTTTTPSDSDDPALAWSTKIKSDITSQLTSTYPAIKITDSTVVPLYKAPNTNYYVSGDGFGKSFLIETGLTSTPNDEQTTANNAILKVINDTFGTDTNLTVTSTSVNKFYQNTDFICSVTIDISPISLYCANIADYASLVSEVAPFAAAYYASDEGKNSVGTISFSKPEITNKTDGYKNAKLGIGPIEGMGGFMGLFYSTASAWTYFTGTQAVLECSQFNTHDLQKAFENEDCYDGSTEKKVTITL